MNHVTEQQDSLLVALDQQTETEVLSWIEKSGTRHDKIHMDHLSRVQDGTGSWFLEADEFRQWSGGSNSTTGSQVLFCPGISGAGKTLITAIAMEHLISRFHQTNHNIAVIYFDYNRDSDNNSTQLLFSILWQFVSHRSLVPREVKEFYMKHYKHDDAKPSDLVSLLEDLVTNDNHHSSFILLDALDEFSDENQSRSEFLDRLKTLLPSPRLRVMETSRPHVDVSYTLPDHAKLSIRAREDDLQLYLDQRVSKMKDLPDGAEHLRRRSSTI